MIEASNAQSDRQVFMQPLGDRLRVLVISDQPYTRMGIVNALNADGRLNVVSQSASDTPLIDTVKLYTPQVIVWELPYDAPQSNVRLAELRDIEVPVLVLLHDETRTAELIAAGTRGVLRPHANATTIAIALTALAADLVVVDSTYSLLTSASEASPLRPPMEILTNRELEVLRLVAEGLPNKQIAIKLSISEHTIKFHINAIMGKLGVQSRTEAVVRATRQGLIAL
jgi:two-component system, NarL family, nitrate/nitrite response regulator NarL